MEKIYAFTNENLTSFNSLYNFNGAKVLSVLGSGDQYFSSLLNGALNVEVYDINPLTWDYFVLKFYGINILSYEEFFDYFVIKKMNDIKYFERISPYLPNNVLNRLINIYQKHKDLSYFLEYIDIAPIIYNDGRIIPYLDKNKYYQLQQILKNTKLPLFYLMDFRKLPNELLDKSYDIVLVSNIFSWIYQRFDNESINNFKKLLENFNCEVIQAIYDDCLINYPDDIKILKENGFDIEHVYPARQLKLFNDSVVSLRKK